MTIDTDDLDALRQRLRNVRTAFADYQRSEGCSCCRGSAHGDNEARIAKLLDVAPYSDDSGFDFTPYRSRA